MDPNASISSTILPARIPSSIIYNENVAEVPSTIINDHFPRLH
ncbi:12446_t:CDS:2, partial [Gigaspora rosea]